MNIEPIRCKHEMIKGTCSLCKGYKQTGSLMSNRSTLVYIRTTPVGLIWDGLTRFNNNTYLSQEANKGKL